ncbi:MAG: patatin-like phospholipase family protein [Hyphomicrobium sp.]
MTSATLRGVFKERHQSSSSPNKRDDPFHVALVVECGGMRGAVAGGIMQVLHDQGIARLVDSVHGASAGACAGAYFLSGQPEEGRRIYHEDICNRRVVNPWRMLSRPCMVDTDFIVDEVIARRRALDIAPILARTDAFHIVTTSATSGKPTVHSRFATADELLLKMKASLRVPGLREPGIQLAGDFHIDGGISAPVPIFSALATGATHIIVARTKRFGEPPRGKWAYKLERSLLALSYGQVVAQAFEQAMLDRSHLTNAATNASGAEVLIIQRSASSPYCSWSTIDRSLLLRVEQDAIDVTQRTLAELLG